MAGYTLILTLAMAAVVYQSDRTITQRLQASLVTDLADEVKEFATAASSRPPQEDLRTFSHDWLHAHKYSRVHLAVVVGLHPGGPSPVLTEPGAAWLAGLPSLTSLVRGRTAAAPLTVIVQRPQGSFRTESGPLIVGGHAVGYYAVAASLGARAKDHSDQLALAISEGLLALVCAVGAGFFLLRRALRTVNKVTKAAGEATRGDLTQRLGYDGPDDEVGRLARTVDAMLTQLDASFTAQRRLLADVSHQLRTPLTVARGHLEVLARQQADLDGEQADTIALVVDELTQMSVMVDRLLMLGQALEPDFLLQERVDLPSLAHEVFEAAHVMAPRNWSLRPVPEVAVWADRSKLRGALLNLVDNAVKATTDQGTIELAFAVGNGIVLQVSDDGRGIAPDDQQLAFDRFRRFARSSAGGAGLGLSIVKAVAEAHGGRVELTSAVQQGCRVAIVLPLSRLMPGELVAAGRAEVR